MSNSASPHWKPWFWVAALVMMIIPGIASLLYLRSAPRKPIDSIAVLPFRNASGDAEAESLCTWITEGLVQSLSRLPDLTVIAREQTFEYDGDVGDAMTTGHQLGARAIVRGSVETKDGSTTVRAELVDTGDNSVIWSQQYSLKPAQIPALRDDITNDIHEHIRFH